MRKYQQLTLLIISTVCVILLLFYRHEYLRLRNVLSVLNFFGNAETANSTCLEFNADLRQSISQRYKYAEPRSVWSKLDNHFLYSSFWEDNDDGGIVRTLTIGPKTSFLNYKCRIWFEEGDLIVSEQGSFIFDIDERSKTKTLGEIMFKYFLKCMVKTKPTVGTPYGVLWSTPTNSSIFLPLFTFRKDEGRVTVCVQPDYSGTPKTEIVEFMSYYNMLGVDDFIIYDSGIQHSIFPFLESSTGFGGILQSVTVLSWNFPISNLKLEKQSLIDDCLSRTFGSAKIVGLVAWNEYIMPASNTNLDRLISAEFDDLTSVSLETWLCCRDREDEQTSKALPTFLRKKFCIRRNQENKIFINMKQYMNSAKRKSYEIPSYTAIVRRYDSCDSTVSENPDQSLPVPEFFSRITTHRLLRLWKTHLNASSIFRS